MLPPLLCLLLSLFLAACIDRVGAARHITVGLSPSGSATFAIDGVEQDIAGKPFPCMGYQPTLSGDNPAYNDVYSPFGRINVIENDMALLEAQGVKTIRTWGFHRIADDYHTFFDIALRHGIYVVPSFPLNSIVYPDIRSPYAKELIMGQWKSNCGNGSP